MKAYKILSLDGGGSWAKLQLLTLLERYGDISGHEILKRFDLIAANSGGSLVLAALIENWKLSEALSIFNSIEKRESIFSKNKFRERYFPIDYFRLLGLNIGPKYSSKRKKDAFDSIFKIGSKTLLSQVPHIIGNKSLIVLVCTYDALNNKAKIFKSSDGDKVCDDILVTQAIHGSSNAPIQYFDYPARFKSQNTKIFFDLWDGALGGFNNPSSLAVNEALQIGIEPENIYLISLGTGNKISSMNSKKKYFDLKQSSIRSRFSKLKINNLSRQVKYFKESILQQAQTILFQPPDWSNEIASTLLFKRNSNFEQKRFIRLSPLIYNNTNFAETTNNLIEDLYKLDMDLMSKKDIDLIDSCFKFWKEGKILNQPIKFEVDRNNNIIPEIGDMNFSKLILMWKGYDV